MSRTSTGGCYTHPTYRASAGLNFGMDGICWQTTVAFYSRERGILSGCGWEAQPPLTGFPYDRSIELLRSAFFILISGGRPFLYLHL